MARSLNSDGTPPSTTIHPQCHRQGAPRGPGSPACRRPADAAASFPLGGDVGGALPAFPRRTRWPPPPRPSAGSGRWKPLAAADGRGGVVQPGMWRRSRAARASPAASALLDGARTLTTGLHRRPRSRRVPPVLGPSPVLPHRRPLATPISLPPSPLSSSPVAFTIRRHSRSPSPLCHDAGRGREEREVQGERRRIEARCGASYSRSKKRQGKHQHLTVCVCGKREEWGGWSSCHVAVCDTSSTVAVNQTPHNCQQHKGLPFHHNDPTVTL